MFAKMGLLSLAFICANVVAEINIENGTDRIRWSSCQQNGSLPLACGSLKVPLDYSDYASNETLDLALVKVSAVKRPKKGSILFNPGGPGLVGREMLAGVYASALLTATGGSYDLISFDTRGTGTTVPFSCFSDSRSRQTLLSKAQFLNTSDTSIGQTWAYTALQAELCHQSNLKTGELLGTAFVARDMMQIVDALGEDGLLRFWGFSYGTALGVTVAAMFPDRMDKIVLDGMLNTYEYYAGRDVEEVTDGDAVFEGFVQGCIENPEHCALAQDAPTAEELSSKIYNLIYHLKYHPFIGGNDTASVIDYVALKLAIQQGLYSTQTWPVLARGIHGLLTGNVTAALAVTALGAGGSATHIYPSEGPESIFGIRCSETSLKTNNLSSLYPLLNEWFEKSGLLGDIFAVSTLQCSQWRFRAKEIYSGGWNIATRNPVLFVNPTHDPFTPLISAKNASAGFEGSVVLEHNGWGHCTIAQPSLCTARAIRAYFEDGTLPAPGTVCEPDIKLFDDWSPKTVLDPIANVTKRDLGRDDDAALLGAMQQLGSGMLSRPRRF